MKKVLFLFFLLAGIGSVGKAQTIKEAYSFKTVTSADTITITYSDNINAVIIRVPSSATDSVVVFGSAKTLSSGTVSQVEEGWKIAPGDPSFGFGSGTNPIRYLYIIVRNIAQIGTMSYTK